MNDELQVNDYKEDFELGVGNALGRGWSEMRENVVVFLLAVLVLTVIMMPVNIDGDDHGYVSALICIL